MRGNTVGRFLHNVSPFHMRNQWLSAFSTIMNMLHACTGIKHSLQNISTNVLWLTISELCPCLRNSLCTLLRESLQCSVIQWHTFQHLWTASSDLLKAWRQLNKCIIKKALTQIIDTPSPAWTAALTSTSLILPPLYIKCYDRRLIFVTNKVQFASAKSYRMSFNAF